MTDAEREIMNRHAAHWRPYLERGDMDPVVTTGTAAFELGRMAAGHVRGR